MARWRPISRASCAAARPPKQRAASPSCKRRKTPRARTRPLCNSWVSASQTLDCEEPQWTGDGRTALRICTLKSNGWPRIVLGQQADGRLYRAEGTPSVLPALQAAIAADSHESPAGGDALVAMIKAKLSDDAIKSSSADYATYQKSIESARLSGAADNYAAAETNYRAALAIEERLFGSQSVVVGRRSPSLRCR